MFKSIIYLFIAVLSFSTLAQRMSQAKKVFETSQSEKKYEIITYHLWLGKFYYSAVPFAKMHLYSVDKFSKEFEKVLQTLVLKTGTENFTEMDYSALKKFKRSPTINFILGLKYYQDKFFISAAKSFNRVPKKHRFYPESQMVMGSILAFKKKYQLANKAYNNCLNSAKELEKLAPKEKIERYYEMMIDSCTIHQARFAFKQKQYDKALKIYDQVPKKSYRWPYTLMEKAWAQYYLNDFNRTLGLLVTYKSPLLRSYFFAETEVLAALSYYRMCLWDDVDVVINNYYKTYTPSSNALKKILTEHKKSDTFFIELTLQPIEKVQKNHPYLRNLITQIRKQIKFNIQLNNLRRSKNEKSYLVKMKESKLKDSLLNEINFIIDSQKRRLNHYIKKEMFAFINNIHKHAFSMFNLKLEVLSRRRAEIYSATNESGTLAKTSVKRGDISNVRTKSSEHYYDFKGEFWADELGDYSFGLASQCSQAGGKNDL